jgi:putative hydrolase
METTISHTDEENRQIADHLREAAQLLADQGSESVSGGRLPRVRRYDRIARRSAARAVRCGRRGCAGAAGSRRRRRAGDRRTAASGRWRLLDRLRGDAERVSAFEAVGIGHGLALRIHDQLQIDTLEEPERAARSGWSSDRGRRPAARPASAPRSTTC